MRNNAAMSAAQIIEELPRLSLVDLEAVRRRAADVSAEKKRASPGPVAEVPDMEAWADRLENLHRKYSTGKAGTPLQQIMDDLRGDR